MERLSTSAENAAAFMGAFNEIDVTALLAERQREVLELLARGRDHLQIAAALGLSEKTVRNPVSAIFARLGVESRAQAIVAAREAGLGGG